MSSLEDQTDEDFFDKLVDDDDFAPDGTADIPRALSNLTLAEVAAPSDSPSEQIQTAEAPVADESHQGGRGKSGTDEAGSLAPSSKGASVKVVQWSAFSANSQPSGSSEFELYSDFLVKDERGSDEQIKTELVPESSFAEEATVEDVSSSVYGGASYEQQSEQIYETGNEQAADSNDARYWENLYPGLKYDRSTGQWYQVDSYDGTPDVKNNVASSFAQEPATMEKSGASYFQQTVQSVLETIAEDSTVSTRVTNWNQVPYESTEYPSNMVFDPQYPGWYYDMNTQEWYSLESYNQALQGAQDTTQNQLAQDVNASSYFVSDQKHNLYSESGQSKQHETGGHVVQEVGGGWDVSRSNYAQNMWQPEPVDKGWRTDGFSVQQQARSFYDLMEHAEGSADRKVSSKGMKNAESGYQFKQPMVDLNKQAHTSNSYYGNQNSESYSQQPFQGVDPSYAQLPCAPDVRRSPDGRPSHALVAFGFGGKLIVMKDVNSMEARVDYGNQGIVGATVSILNLTETVTDNVDASSRNGGSNHDYFHALCQQSFPGPLIGGNAATKDVNKWIDERIADCGSPHMDIQKGELLRLLLSLLKISCQHYGKLQSPFASDLSVEDVDGPESAVTKLFASARKNSASLKKYGFSTHCIQNLPSEGQIKATASEVQDLLVSGRRKEALLYAQEGQLWGPALVLAAQLGEKFYIDTVRQMAHHQFISGSPLRTLCLLIAGQPADVFSADCFANSLSGAVTAPQPAQIRATGMLDDWEENLAIITANRTKDDELVIIHLGDCLWKERGEITAAHTCYLVAEANFESHSDSARLCLIGSDHWKYPRTYASPEAIQRTEVYEYSKVLGNSQFVLHPFQPYKLIYAYMLAEVGKVADALRYCQASLKLLKNSGRAPEVELWKSLLSSLEERLRTHQQGGYSANLDPAKLVGKLFTSIDRSIHRMIGAPPPSLPPVPQSTLDSRHNYSLAPKVPNSQSTMAMSSLIPSASFEAISEWTGDAGRKTRHNRSVSEPDFGRSPKQAEGSADNKGSGGPSRFGRIGSQFIQKTMGWESKSRSDRQAKLGETNKFYFDEKLKRWVEEGAGPPPEEAALPPPPRSASFQNGMSDYNINNAVKSQNIPANGAPETMPSTSPESNSGFPPIPPSQNQFSSRGRVGVRSRYVDTFNKGGAASMNSFQMPSAPSLKPAVGAKFFIPTSTKSNEHSTDAIVESEHEVDADGGPSTSVVKDSPALSPPPSSSSSMQRFPSMDNLNAKSESKLTNGNGPSSHERRASWSGNYPDIFNSQIAETNSTGVGFGMSPSFAPSSCPPVPSSGISLQQRNGGNLGDDLHEVDL